MLSHMRWKNRWLIDSGCIVRQWSQCWDSSGPTFQCPQDIDAGPEAVLLWSEGGLASQRLFSPPRTHSLCAHQPPGICPCAQPLTFLCRELKARVWGTARAACLKVCVLPPCSPPWDTSTPSPAVSPTCCGAATQPPLLTSSPTLATIDSSRPSARVTLPR